MGEDIVVATSMDRGRAFLLRGRENERAMAARPGKDGVVGREMDGPSSTTLLAATLVGV